MIEIKKPNLQVINFSIYGTSPLIVHRWSEKAKKEILDKQMKKAKTVKKAKDPEKDYEDSLYRLSDGSFGFPAVAFKCAAVRAATSLDMTMVQARQLFHVIADDGDLVRLNGTPEPREDMVRLNGKVPDIRYRGEFKKWSVDLAVRYDADAFSTEQLCNLFERAGFSVGVGEWRPEKNGIFGCFSLLEDEAA